MKSGLLLFSSQSSANEAGAYSLSTASATPATNAPKESYLPLSYTTKFPSLKNGCIHSIARTVPNQALASSSDHILLLTLAEGELKSKVLYRVAQLRETDPEIFPTNTEIYFGRIKVTPDHQRFILDIKVRKDNQTTTILALFRLTDEKQLILLSTQSFLKVSFISNLYDNLMFIGTRGGDFSLVQIEEDSLDKKPLHNAHENEILSIKYLSSTPEEVVFLTSCKTEIKKWRLVVEPESKKTAVKFLWEKQFGNTSFLFDYYWSASPHLLCIKEETNLFLLNTADGSFKTQMEFKDVNFVAFDKTDANILLVFADQTLFKINMTTGKVQDSLGITKLRMNYPESVKDIRCLENNAYLISNGIELLKFDFAAREITFFNSFSSPEHFGANDWEFINDQDLVIVQNADLNPMIGLKTYQTKPINELDKKKIWVGANRDKSSVLARHFFSSPIFEPKMIAEIEAYAEVGKPAPSSGGNYTY